MPRSPRRSPKRTPARRPYDAMLLRDVVQAFLRAHPSYERKTTRQLLEYVAVEAAMQMRRERTTASPMPSFEDL